MKYDRDDIKDYLLFLGAVLLAIIVFGLGAGFLILVSRFTMGF